METVKSKGEEKMKKLFISCPMKGRTEENIKKSMEQMHKIAEIMFDQKLEVIPTYIEDAPPANSNEGVWYLGRSIQLMAEADFFVGVCYTEFFNGCTVEYDVARKYGIKSIQLDMYQFMPDAVDAEREFYNSMVKKEE